MIDLHTHSLFSDGTDEPRQIALQADRLGLYAVALTDHDTLAGLPEFLSVQPSVKTRLIPGLELSCRFLTGELHILGLFINPDDPKLQERIEDMRKRREERNVRMIHRIGKLGIPLTWQEVRAMASTNLLSRAHFARALVRRGAASSPQDAFKRILSEGSPGYVPFRELEPSEAAQWIREAGGVPIVAHPGRSAGSRFLWDKAMLDLKAEGIAGFETYYGEYGPSEERYFCDLASRLGMARSGGSDYHGTYKPGLTLGKGRGNLDIPDEIIAELEALKR